jgi:GNAT superfamily N-acetyltransferase
MTDVGILAVSGPDLIAMKEEIAAVGRAPSSGEVRKPGFRACTARVASGRLIALAYGWEGGPGDWWWDIVAGAVSAEVRRRWFDDCFELVDLAVLPGERRRGIGGALHDALLALTERPHTVLSVLDDGTAALAFFATKGWRAVHPGLRFPGNDAPFAVLVRDR